MFFVLTQHCMVNCEDICVMTVPTVVACGEGRFPFMDIKNSYIDMTYFFLNHKQSREMMLKKKKQKKNRDHMK